MTRIFLTGTTGYLGGQVLHALSQKKSPGIQIAGIFRDKAKADQVKQLYPDLEIVIGDLDDNDLITKQAEQSDIVLHLASTSHVPSAKSISTGLQTRHTSTKTAPYWIQISGATCYAAHEIAESHYGHHSNDTYDDVKDRDAIVSLLRNTPKRVVEQTVLSQDPSSVQTALIIGPLIYGVGEGPGNQRSIQAPEITKVTLELGHAFKLGKGENAWSNVHVADIAGLVECLVDKAVEGKAGIWNEDGVYNVEGGEMTFKDLNAAIANEAHKQRLIKEDANSNTETIDAAKADSLSGHASVLWGTNARTVASKARQQLGWKPTSKSLPSTLPDLVRSEAGNGQKN